MTDDKLYFLIFHFLKCFSSLLKKLFAFFFLCAFTRVFFLQKKCASFGKKTQRKTSFLKNFYAAFEKKNWATLIKRGKKEKKTWVRIYAQSESTLFFHPLFFPSKKNAVRGAEEKKNWAIHSLEEKNAEKFKRIQKVHFVWMEFYLALFFTHFFALQKNRIDKLFPKMEKFLFFEEKIEIEFHPLKNKYSLFSNFDNFVLSSRFFHLFFSTHFFRRKKRAHRKKMWRKRKFEHCEKIQLFQSKKGNYRKNCKNKKMAKKNSFVFFKLNFHLFFFLSKKGNRKISIRKCFRPRLFSLWLDQIPINKL